MQEVTAIAKALDSPAELQQTIKVLSRINSVLSVYHLLEIWGVIALAIYSSVTLVPLSSGVLGFLVYLLAVAVIASRQHALMVMTHEGIHKRLSRRLWFNDWLARFLAGFPVFISLAKWRFIHLYHHQYTHTGDDPDRAIFARYPLAQEKFVRLLMQDFCGFNVLSTVKYFIDLPFGMKDFNRRFLGETRSEQYRHLADMSVFALFWSLVLFGGLWFWGSKAVVWFALYWLVPYCTFTQVFFRIRGAIEHGNVPDPQNLYQQTRTYFLHPVVGFFFAPKQVNYHLEHHLYPSVPFYNLPRLHIKLRQTIYPQEHGYCEAFAVSLQKLVTKERPAVRR
jgi:fatty acid desaturase